MQPPAIGFGDQRRDRSTTAGQHRILGACVRMPANARRVALVIAEKALQIVDRQSTKAVALGLDGIVVSNHGGRRLDGMPATIDMLPEIVATVGGRAEVYMDGGVRRGTDVLIALALGARGVLIGRPYAWALGADGEAGVRKVLDLFRDELLNAMVATGCAKVSDIQPTLLRRP